MTAVVIPSTLTLAMKETVLPDDWRNQLATQLGQRPRRVGVWAELALYGALQCLEANGLQKLSSNTALRVTSASGPSAALALVGQSCDAGELPMPFDFLQSQPSQMLAALSQYLGWQGDAAYLSQASPGALQADIHAIAATLRQQAARHQRPWDGLLFGHVDLLPTLRSQWCLIL